MWICIDRQTPIVEADNSPRCSHHAHPRRRRPQDDVPAAAAAGEDGYVGSIWRPEPAPDGYFITFEELWREDLATLNGYDAQRKVEDPAAPANLAGARVRALWWRAH